MTIRDKIERYQAEHGPHCWPAASIGLWESEMQGYEIEEQETDALVRSELEQLIERIRTYGRTVYGVRVKGEVRGRYDALIRDLNDVIHDNLPGANHD